MQIAEDQVAEVVNCRIGSLETDKLSLVLRRQVNCRIGSLENKMASSSSDTMVNCRIGSLEIKQPQQD